MRKWLFLAVFIFAAAQSVDAKKYDNTEVLEFIETVILGTEYGASAPVCSRWVTSPTMSVFDASEKDMEMVTEIVDDINLLLEPSNLKVKFLEPNQKRADIKVMFADAETFPDIAKKYGFYYVPGNAGYFYIRWNAAHHIYNAVILIDKELKGKKKKHFLREEITQSLGLANDSPMYKSSIFYAKGAKGGKATRFSELDQRLIRFFYQYIKPGYNIEQVRGAFFEYWQDITLPGR